MTICGGGFAVRRDLRDIGRHFTPQRDQENMHICRTTARKAVGPGFGRYDIDLGDNEGAEMSRVGASTN